MEAKMADDYRRRGWWRDQTFLDDLRRTTRDDPGRIAVITRAFDRAPGPVPDIRRLDYAELSLLADRAAGTLVELGVRPGGTVAVQLNDRWELAVLALACMRAGARFCPLLPMYRRRELEIMLGLTEARVFITQARHAEADLGALAVSLAAELPSLAHVVVADGPRPAGTLGLYETFLAPSRDLPAPALLDARELGPDDPYLTLFTSGTTGEPKGVLHSANTLYAAVRGEAGVFGLDSSLVMCTTASYTHYTGVVQGMLMPIMLGGTMVFQDDRDTGAVLDLLAEERVTFLYVAPYYLRRLFDEQRSRPRDLALEWLVSGSASIPPHYVDLARDVFGLRLFSLWGMSENGPVTISRPDDPEDWASRSDGSPISDMEFRIDPLPGQPDGIGVLWVRGPTQCLGYDRRPEVYAASLDEDGWFNTGDLARHDGRGGIRIEGRVGDAIKHRAFVIPVTDIEAVVAQHPKVAEATVIGLPVGEGEDEQICAVVTAADGSAVTLDELRASLKDAGMMEMYWPQRLEVVSALPKTANGKVRKVELKERYAVR
ncbi:MAG: AMP-binding protein [Streptosporangiales bacterium]|nr:AMP-binding protein [Streptosporangiales bacterium]